MFLQGSLPVYFVALGMFIEESWFMCEQYFERKTWKIICVFNEVCYTLMARIWYIINIGLIFELSRHSAKKVQQSFLYSCSSTLVSGGNSMRILEPSLVPLLWGVLPNVQIALTLNRICNSIIRQIPLYLVIRIYEFIIYTLDLKTAVYDIDSK